MIARALVLAFSLLVVPASAGAATRYASPSGAGDCTTAASACSLTTAVTGASGGDEVIVAAGMGAYGAPGSELILNDDNGAVTIRGAVTGPARPVVNGRFTLGTGSRLEDLKIVSAVDSPVNLGSGAVANRIVAEATAGSLSGCTLNFGGELRNSLCIASGLGSDANGVLLNGQSAAPLARNVTAIGGAYGLIAYAPSLVEASILQGGAKEDFKGLAVNEAAGLTNVLRDSLFADVSPQGYAPNGADGRVTDPPSFVVAGDYREKLGSKTIDAGDVADNTTDTLDLNGNLRKLGTHVDIGAYEYVPAAPIATTGTQTTSTADGNSFKGTIQTGGGRADIEFVGTGVKQSIPASLSTTPVSATITGLGDAPTPYRLKVTTDGGSYTTDEYIAYRSPTLTPADATNVTATTVTLNGTVALKGAPTADVEFVYGAATSAPQSITGDGAVSQALTGLTPNTTYQWKLRVKRDGENFETAIGTFKTTAAGTTPTGTATPSPGGEPTASPTPAPTADPTPAKPAFTVGPGTSAGRTEAGRALLFSRKGLTISFRCGEVACGAKASGTVSIGKKRYGTLAAPRKALQLAAGERGQIRLTANARLRKRVARYLKKHRKTKAIIRLKVVFTEAGGTKVTKTLTIKVRRLTR